MSSAPATIVAFPIVSVSNLTARPPMSDRKRAFLDNADRMAPRRRDWIARNAAYYADDRRYMRYLIPSGMRVLDLGCGTGELLASLKPVHGVGLDLSARMVEEARKAHSYLTFIEGDAEDPDVLASLGGPFDYIVISDTIGMFEDIEVALKGLHHLCTAETRIVIAYYSPSWEPFIRLGTILGRRMPQPQPNLLTKTDFLNILDLAEFESIRIEQRQLVPFGLLGLGRLVNRFIAPLPGIRRLCLRTYLVARSRSAPRQSKPSTSIVIPCRNEQGNIERAIKEMPRFGGHQEIIFVEGNSNDDTLAECRRVQTAYTGEWDIKVLKQDGKGKGDAVRKGFAHAKGDILMILDADLTMPPSALPKFYHAIAGDKGEFVNGTRLVYPRKRPCGLSTTSPIGFLPRCFPICSISVSPTRYAAPRYCGASTTRKSSLREVISAISIRSAISTSFSVRPSRVYGSSKCLSTIRRAPMVRRRFPAFAMAGCCFG